MKGQPSMSALLEQSRRALAAGRRWESVCDDLRSHPQEVRRELMPHLLRWQAERMLAKGVSWTMTCAWLRSQPAQYLPDAQIRTLCTPSEGAVIAPGVTLVRPAGHGGFGEVWEAATRHGRCAVKLLRGTANIEDIAPTGHTAAELTRLRDEATLLRSLGRRSRHLPKIRASGQWRGRWFIVMEWIEGLDIRTHCLERRLGMLERIDLCLQAAKALLVAHEAGVAHLDLKPSNILVTRVDGRDVVKLIDFGVGRRIRRRTGRADHRTTPEFGNGRPRTEVYASPEQAQGESPGHDWRSSDVYSLAVVAHELLYGFRPWQWIEPHDDSMSPELGRALGSRRTPDDYLRARSQHTFPDEPRAAIDRLGRDRTSTLATLALHRGLESPTFLEWVAHGPLWLALRDALVCLAEQRTSMKMFIRLLRGVRASNGRHSWDLAGREGRLPVTGGKVRPSPDPDLPPPNNGITAAWSRRMTKQGTPLAEVVLNDTYEFDLWERRGEDTLPLLRTLAARHLDLWFVEMKAGNAAACWLIGQHRERLLGDERDAVYWYRMGAERGDARCLVWLGMAHHFGIGGVRHDLEAAIEHFMFVAGSNNHARHVATLMLTKMLAGGNGAPMDLPGMRERLLHIAREDNGVACHELATAEITTSSMKHIEKPMHWMRRAAELGVIEARHQYAELLFRLWIHHGKGDPSEVLYWLELSGAAGDPRNLCRAARMIANGNGAKRSPTLAIGLLERWGRDDPATLHCRSRLLRLRRRRGDRALAYRACLEAARAGHAEAQVDLAMHFHRPGGFKPNRREVARWLRAAARAGSPEGCYQYACLIARQGRFDESRRFIYRAADAGHSNAMHDLAVNLERGGRRSSLVTALAWYDKLARQGWVEGRDGIARVQERLAAIGGRNQADAASP